MHAHTQFLDPHFLVDHWVVLPVSCCCVISVISFWVVGSWEGSAQWLPTTQHQQQMSVHMLAIAMTIHTPGSLWWMQWMCFQMSSEWGIQTGNCLEPHNVLSQPSLHWCSLGSKMQRQTPVSGELWSWHHCFPSWRGLGTFSRCTNHQHPEPEKRMGTDSCQWLCDSRHAWAVFGTVCAIIVCVVGVQESLSGPIIIMKTRMHWVLIVTFLLWSLTLKKSFMAGHLPLTFSFWIIPQWFVHLKLCLVIVEGQRCQNHGSTVYSRGWRLWTAVMVSIEIG